MNKKKIAFSFPIFLLSLFTLFAANPAEKKSSSDLSVLSPSDPLMERGLLLMTQQQYEAAILEFSKIAQDYPSDHRRDESLFQIAECYRYLGRNSDALNAYLYLEKSNPKTLYLPQIQIQVGLLYGKAEKYKEAIPYLQKAIQNPPSEVRSLLQYALGLALLRNQEASEAIPLLKSVLQTSPTTFLSPLASWVLADHYEKTGNLLESLTYWKQTLALTTDEELKAQASSRAGWILLQQEKIEEATPLLDETRKLNKTGNWRKIANSGLLQIKYQQKKYEEVLQLYKEERQNFLDSRRSEIFLMVGISHYQLKNMEKAVEVLGLFTKNFPQHPQLLLASYTRLMASIQLDPKNVSAETAAFLSKFPQSEYTNSVKLLRAQDFNQRKKYEESIPMWEDLNTLKDPKLPRDQILFERARSYYETASWIKAAAAFTDFLQEFPQQAQSFSARLSKAVALQQSGKHSIEAWEEVLLLAPRPSPSHQMALEQIGLLASKNELQEKMRKSFQDLIDHYPESEIIPLAYFKLATLAIQEKESLKALALFDQARKRDSKTWGYAATQQMLYLAYDLKKAEQTLTLLTEFEQLCSQSGKNDLMPAAIYYWLGQVHFDQKKFTQAVNFFAAVNSHPQPGNLRNPAWWYLAESQREAGLWKFAIASYQRFEKLDPDKAKTNQFLLALAQSHLGAKEWNLAQSLAEKVMLQDPEGKSSTQARFLVAESHEGRQDYLSAAKSFAAIAVLYQDPYWTPHAMHRASLAFTKSGDSVTGLLWAEKLKKAYPQFRK